MKILILTRFYLNGQSTHVFSLCNELKRQGHSPFLVITHLNDPEYILYLRHSGLPYTTKDTLSYLRWYIKKYECDVIHSHSAHTLSIALELGQDLGIPVVATCHHLDFPNLAHLNSCTKVITISKEMQELLAINPRTSTVIENGIDTRLYRPQQTPYRSLTAVLLTRMSPQKEPGFILVSKMLIDHGWRVISLGNWHSRRLPIEYKGWKTRIEQTINKAELVVGTGRAVREGMAAGCACLVLGNKCDGLVAPANVKLLQYYNFSGRATKMTPTHQTLHPFISQLTTERISELGLFGHRYANTHFLITSMVANTVKLYWQAFQTQILREPSF